MHKFLGDPQHYLNWAWWCTPVIPAPWRQRQEDTEFYVILGYTVSSRLAPVTEPLSQESKLKKSKSDPDSPGCFPKYHTVKIRVCEGQDPPDLAAAFLSSHSWQSPHTYTDS